ncbi:MAG TPA: hypothetical protein VLK23_16135 [Thermodesulfobacteriota bacterium]|nr:hypothetical protein [Thermodesulfobacteriota bacterium]
MEKIHQDLVRSKELTEARLMLWTNWVAEELSPLPFSSLQADRGVKEGEGNTHHRGQSYGNILDDCRFG